MSDKQKKTCGGDCWYWIRNCPDPDVGWCSREIPRDYLRLGKTNMVSYYADYPDICPKFSETETEEP